MNSKNLTRRDLAFVGALAAAAAKAMAQAQPAPGSDWYQAAIESHKRNTQTLAEFQIAVSVEPAFHFKA